MTCVRDCACGATWTPTMEDVRIGLTLCPACVERTVRPTGDTLDQLTDSVMHQLLTRDLTPHQVRKVGIELLRLVRCHRDETSAIAGRMQADSTRLEADLRRRQRAMRAWAWTAAAYTALGLAVWWHVLQTMDAALPR